MIHIQNVLCPLDFEEPSHRALKYASSISRRYGALLHLVHVVHEPVSTSYAASLDVPDHASRQAAARQAMKKFEAEVTASGVRVDSSVGSGEIDNGIGEAVQATGSDVVVMGTHGRRSFERWFLGSATERTLRRSPVPILTIADVGGDPRVLEHVRNILVTTDFSGETDVPLAWASSLAEGGSAAITLLHVDVLSTGPDQDAETLTQLQEIAGRVPNVTCRVEAGEPYRRILEVIDEENIDLVVMNIHGKGMLERALLGTTAERVIRAATCPVLGIPVTG